MAQNYLTRNKLLPYYQNIIRNGLILPLIFIGITAYVFPQTRSVTMLKPANDLHLKFEQIDVNKGLSHNDVYCVFQDSKGYLWFGTEYGLSRYDGFRITTYVHDPLNANSLSNNRVLAICEDANSNLWIGTRRGLNKFDSETNTFINYSIGYVTSLSMDNSGMIWAGMLTGLSTVDLATQKWRYFKHSPDDPNSLSGNEISKIITAKNGRIWISTATGLNEAVRLPDNSIQFKNYPISAKNDTAPLLDICEDANGKIWTVSAGEVYRFDPETSAFQFFGINASDSKQTTLSSISTDVYGNIWIGSDNGLFRLVPNSNSPDQDVFPGKLIHYEHQPAHPFGLSNNKISEIFADQQGVLWFATLGGGLNKTDLESILFKTIKNNGKSGLTDNNVWSILETHDHSLLVGTDDGVTRISTDPFGELHYKPLALPFTSKQSPVRSMIEDIENNRLWIATTGHGLIQYDLETQTAATYRGKPDSPSHLQSDQLYAVFMDSRKNIWVGANDSIGLYRFDRETKKFTGFRYEARRTETDRWITSFSEDPQTGDLWIGTWQGGLIKFDHSANKIVRFYADPEYPKTLVAPILSVYSDKNSNVWIGTNGNGLFRLATSNGEKPHQYRQFRFEENLVDDIVNAIAADDNGKLWLSTSQGILNFDPETASHKRYEIDDGLQGNQFNWGAFFKGADGQIYFGGRNGLNHFYPKSNTNPFPPKIIFTDIRKNGNESIFRQNRSINLNHDDKYFSFEFLAMHFKKPEDNRFAVKMDGFDNDWIDIENRRQMTYSILPKGEYTFRVKAANSDGIIGESDASVKVVVHPPWWETWWAYLAYLSVTIIAIVSIVRIRERNMKRRTEELETTVAERTAEVQAQAERLREMDELKSRFFANISHEFRTPLTLISGPVKQLLNGNFRGSIDKQYKVILNNCTRLLQLINQLLDLSKLESGGMKLKTQPENISVLTRYLTTAFESMATQRKIELQFHSKSVSNNGTFGEVYLDREKYEKILYNLLSNALKFTKANGRVDVTLDYVASQNGFGENGYYDKAPKSYARITIRDTGIGISPEKLPHIFDRFYQVEDSASRQYEGTGIGLSLTKELVELHHGTISATSEPQHGTTFTLLLPTGKAHLSESEIVEPAKRVIFSENDAAASPFSLLQFSENTIPTNEFNEDLSQDFGENGNPERDKPKVLIVDDNTDMRGYLRDFLSAHFRVTEAGNGIEGLYFAKKMLPELIISDVMMPEMDGMAFCEQLKTDIITSHIPVILLTALAEQSNRLEGLETGADAYLNKPFDAEEVLVYAKNLIRLRRNLRERFSKITVPDAAKITVNAIDKHFIEKAVHIVEQHLADYSFNRDVLASEMAMSVRNLNRKLTALTNCSANQFIRNLRLKHAKMQLENRVSSVSDVAYNVGFSNPSYFAKCFTEAYGVPPSYFINGNGKNGKK